MTVVRFIFNVAMIMVPVKAAERKFRVHLIAGLNAVCVMTRFSNQLVDILFRNFVIVENNLKFLGFGIP
jgi:hypothetical protein